MRLLGAIVVVVLATSNAYAERPPFEVVQVLAETNQVLVFDRGNNKHVLLEPGATFDDYMVVEISGSGMVVQKQQERIIMYPRGMRGLALNLDKDEKGQPQPVYGKVAPPTGPAVAVSTKSDKVAIELAQLLTGAPTTRAPRTRVR